MRMIDLGTLSALGAGPVQKNDESPFFPSSDVVTFLSFAGFQGTVEIQRSEDGETWEAWHEVVAAAPTDTSSMDGNGNPGMYSRLEVTDYVAGAVTAKMLNN